MPRTTGYMRALEDEVDQARRLEMLAGEGCSSIFVEHCQANVRPAPEWQACLASLEAGDQLVVPNLEQMAFTLEQLAETLADLIDRGIQLKLIDWSPNQAPELALLHDVVMRLDSFERAGRRELINAGLNAARTEGRVGGRRYKLTPEQIAELKTQMDEPGADPIAVGARFGLSRASVYKYLKR